MLREIECVCEWCGRIYYLFEEDGGCANFCVGCEVNEIFGSHQAPKSIRDRCLRTLSSSLMTNVAMGKDGADVAS